MNVLKVILIVFLFLQACSGITRMLNAPAATRQPVVSGVALAIVLAIYGGLVVAVVYA